MRPTMTERDDGLVKYMKDLDEFQSGFRTKNGGVDDWVFKSQEGFYLAKGHLFPHEPLTEQESRLLADIIGGSLFKTKECYMNAAIIVLEARRLEGTPDEITYCEGIALGRVVIPVHHAWVSLHGKAIDVTWQEFGKRHTRTLKKVLARIDNNIRECSYYGVEVPSKLLSKHIVAAGRYSPVIEGTNYDHSPIRTGSIEQAGA